MEPRKPEPGASTAAATLEIADKQIASLKDRHLPLVPHLLYVPTKTPYLPEFPFENQNTPFDPSEVMQLQYMTMISNPDRGVGRTRGDWQDDLAAQGKSPWSVDARSSTSTPNPFKDSKKSAANKISIADYKNMKQTGVKPSPRPATSTPALESQSKPGHSRNTSAASVSTPMIRGLSFEGAAEVKQNGASVTGNSVKHAIALARDAERHAMKSSETDRREKPRSVTNGHVENRQREAPQDKEAIKDLRAQRPGSTLPARPTLTHALPPRPQSPPRRNNLGLKQNAGQKRPNPALDTPPEKRTKIEQSRTPSNSQNPVPRKPDNPSQSNAASSKPYKSTPTSQPSSLTKKDVSSKETQSKYTSKSDRPRDLPPLLSPLAMELDDPILSLDPAPSADPAISNVKKEAPGKVSSSNTPSRSKLGADTIVVKGRPESSSHTSPAKPPTQTRPRSPLILPRILSPGLPDVVELALAEWQKKKPSTSKLDTVEARHEKARQPDAPGVARKTPKIKGNAQRRSAEEGGREAAPRRLIVKIPYKKRQATDIKRLLNMRPRPDPTFLRLEAERKAQESGRKDGLQPSAFPKDEESSDDEGPIVKIKAAASASRKRPSDTSIAEPAQKRTKIPDASEDVRSQTPVPSAFKSPAVSGSKEKGLLATPKKADAMKSVAMRKVDSSDGMARTPQPTSMSTPASAERSRLNGSVEPRSLPGSVDLENLRSDEKKYSELALKLKRKMDSILQTKSKDPQARDSVSEKDKKMGLATGIECVVVYMNAFHLTDRCSILSNRTHSPSHWNSVLALLSFLNHAITNYPVFEAVCAQVGAVCREQLDRQYWDASKDPIQHRDPKFWGAARENAVKKQSSWEEAERTRPILRDLAGDMVLGPWSDVKQVTAYAIGVLTAFSRKEQTGWKRDPGFQ